MYFFEHALKYQSSVPYLAKKLESKMAYKLSADTRHCLECGSEINYGGRIDRKFCSSSCKNKYWNRRNSSRQGYQLKIISLIDRNYHILTRLMAIGVRSVRREDLLLLGFRFDIMTGHQRRLKRDWYECFDIRYLQTPSRISNLQYVAVEDAAESQAP